MTFQEYIISFLLGNEEFQRYVSYTSFDKISEQPSQIKIVILKSNFFNEDVYSTESTIPKTPFAFLPSTDIPFLFGEPRVEKTADGKIILYADLVASAYFMLSRYEEIVKPNCRDKYGRFLAKDSVVFQQGYGMRPLVDEWGRYLRNLLCNSGVELPEEQKGFKKIYLTHDVDMPFLLYRKEQVIKQWIKSIIHFGSFIKNPISIYKNPDIDPQYTFKKIIEVDESLRNSISNPNLVESIYFLISRGSKKTKNYCDIQLSKFQNLLKILRDSKATLGLHVSYEAGENQNLINEEMVRLKKYCSGATSKSRHHFLRWTEPEHIDQMETAGITEDFTLEYADSVGFRVGTCRPYYFINPRTKAVTKILEHPMAIMECSLDRPNYMGLSYSEAKNVCKKLIDETYEFNGELVLLFHNPIWSATNYYGQLYEELLRYISNFLI